MTHDILGQCSPPLRTGPWGFSFFVFEEMRAERRAKTKWTETVRHQEKEEEEEEGGGGGGGGGGSINKKCFFSTSAE